MPTFLLSCAWHFGPRWAWAKWIASSILFILIISISCYFCSSKISSGCPSRICTTKNKVKSIKGWKTYHWIYLVNQVDSVFDVTVKDESSYLHPMLDKVLVIQINRYTLITFLFHIDSSLLYELSGSLFVAFNNQEVKHQLIQKSLWHLYLIKSVLPVSNCLIIRIIFIRRLFLVLVVIRGWFDLHFYYFYYFTFLIWKWI